MPRDENPQKIVVKKLTSKRLEYVLSASNPDRFVDDDIYVT